MEPHDDTEDMDDKEVTIADDIIDKHILDLKSLKTRDESLWARLRRAL